MKQQALKMPVTKPSISKEKTLVATVVSSICMLGREAWNACFPAEIETFDYLLAVEKAGIAGFKWRYVVVREDEDIIAVMPAFLCDYALETTLETGRIRQAVEKVRGVFKRFLTLRLACLGSPCTETGAIGFAPGIDEARRPALFFLLLDVFEAHARKERCSLTALKDLAQPLPTDIANALSARGYANFASMPTAWLDIEFKSIDEYLAMLSSGTRKDMRRKLRSREKIRVEYRKSFGDLLPRVMQLYLETRQRSEWQFEELTPDYFDGILKRMPENSFCAMYFSGEELLAANLMIHDGDRLIDKFFCMDAEKGRPYNLYYLSWFTNLDYCLRHGIRRYQSGQAYYRNKVRLGSKLTANAMYFRHRNPALQFMLRKISPLLVSDDGFEAVP